MSIITKEPAMTENRKFNDIVKNNNIIQAITAKSIKAHLIGRIHIYPIPRPYSAAIDVPAITVNTQIKLNNLDFLSIRIIPTANIKALIISPLKVLKTNMLTIELKNVISILTAILELLASVIPFLRFGIT